MTLSEAIKAGVPFKRPSWAHFILFKEDDFILPFAKNDILADDYELKEETPKTVTRWLCFGPSAIAGLTACWLNAEELKSVDSIHVYKTEETEEFPR